MRAAGLLRDVVVDVAVNRVPLVDAVSRYQSEMLRYGLEAVANSRQQQISRGRPITAPTEKPR